MARYGNRGSSAVVGVNLDGDTQETAVRTTCGRIGCLGRNCTNRADFDSRLANEMGIVTVPTMMLVDQNGKVIHRGIDISQLEAELNRLSAVTTGSDEIAGLSYSPWAPTRDAVRAPP